MNGSEKLRFAVIIPAYNAEAFIERSVKSVLNQSYKELKLIVVDDGSTDATAEKLSSLSAADPRLKVMTVENRGPAAARNAALALLDDSTEYVMFMDADDVLEPDTLDYVLQESAGAELVIFGFSIDDAGGTARDYSEPKRLLNRETLGGALAGLYKANLLNQVWGKVFRFSLIHENAVSFPDYMWGEDRLFVCACLEHAETVAILPECKYHYIMHPGESLISKFYEKKPTVCLEADKRMQSLCTQLSVDDEADFRYMFAKSIFSCMTTLFSRNCQLSPREKREYVRSIVKNEEVCRRCKAVFGGAAVNALCAVVRSGSVGLNMAVFRGLAAFEKLNPELFIKIKHRK